MKVRFYKLIIYCWFCLAFNSHSTFLDISIFSGLESDPLSSITTVPGGVIDVWTHISTDELISGLTYKTVLPTTGWSLNSRDYGSKGWESNDGVYDASVPLEGGSPILIGDDLFGDPGSAPDFRFSSAVTNFPGNITGSFAVEDIILAVPIVINPGPYTLDLIDVRAFTFDGVPLTISNVNSLQIEVIPEPSTSLLFVLVIICISSRFLYSRRSHSK